MTRLLTALSPGFALVCLAQSPSDNSRTFEVASVKATVHPRKANFSFTGPDRLIPGGRFSAAIKFAGLIGFAYDVRLWGETRKIAFAHAPSWVTSDLYAVEARGTGDATRAQMRAMVRNLLEERFKLSVRFEDKEIAVLAMTLDKPGKTGPQLRQHAIGLPCPERNRGEFKPSVSTGKSSPDANVFPAFCGDYAGQSSGGRMKMGGRDNSMDDLAAAILQYRMWTDEISKPIVDRTGLRGSFDYTLEWSGHGPRTPAPAGAVAIPSQETDGPSFVRALREQLGVRLVPARTTVHIPVITHVKRPSGN